MSSSTFKQLDHTQINWTVIIIIGVCSILLFLILRSAAEYGLNTLKEQILNSAQHSKKKKKKHDNDDDDSSSE